MQEKLRQILSDMVTHIETIGGKEGKIEDVAGEIYSLFKGFLPNRNIAPEPESETVFFPASEIKGTAQTLSGMVVEVQKKERKPRKKAKRDKKKRIRILTEEELRIKRGGA